MRRRLFIDRDVMQTRVAIIEDDRIAEIFVEATDAPLRHGEIRSARVTHLSHDIQAATVDAGNGLSLFLRAADARVLAGAGTGKRPAIGQVLKRGQNLLVQLGREALEGKQARASADIALSGRYLTLYPMRTGLEAGKRPLPDDLAAGLTTLSPDMQVVVRPAAHEVGSAVVLAEAERLRADWQAVLAAHKPVPGLRRAAPGLVLHALQHLSGPAPDGIMVAERGLLAELKALARDIAPDLVDSIELTDPRRSLDLDDEIDAALSVEVAATGKVGLSIEPTRAMTVIDVDGAGSPLDVNLAAVPAIARQLRLRHIGGPVAVDFVSMGKAPDRKRVEGALRQALKPDPEQVEISQIDRFGILTLVRRRNGPSLAEQLGGPCNGLSGAAQLACLLRRASAELAGTGLLPVTLSLPEPLKAAAPDDLGARLGRHLGRPLIVAFDDLDIDDFRLKRER